MSLLHQQSLTLLLVLIQVLFVPAVFTAPVYLNDAVARHVPKSSPSTDDWFTPGVSSLPTATRANAAIMTRILDMTAMGQRADTTSAPSDAGSTSTTSLESSNTNTTMPASAIVEGVAGGTVVLVLFVSVIFVTRRRNVARIDPLPLEVPVERDQAREHGAEMSQHSLSIPSSNPKVRATTGKRSLTARKLPLLPTETASQASYNPSPTASFHYATISDVKRTLSHAADASSVVSSDLDWHRRRPLPPLPVPDAAVAYASPHGDTLAVVTQSLVHDQSPWSPPLITPVSALVVELADCTEPFAPARCDSQVEPACSIRRLSTPPPRTPDPAAGLSFDGDGRPDTPSMARMFTELLELQRQVVRIREDLPFDAPPDYAESVVGRTRHAAAP